MRHLIVVMVLSCLCACQYIPQDVKIAPTVEVTESNIGQGKLVAVQVLDERENSTIGKRGFGFETGATIATEQNVSQLFQTAVSEGLQRNGFKPVPDNVEAPTNLRVEIRTLNYDVAMGLWTGENSAESAVKVEATNGEARYEKMYRGRSAIRTVFHASQETNTKIINAAINDVLDTMFADRKLLEFLAR